MGGVLKMIGGLTKKGGAGDGSDGFMQLLQGAGGGSGGNKIVHISVFIFVIGPFSEIEESSYSSLVCFQSSLQHYHIYRTMHKT